MKGVNGIGAAKPGLVLQFEGLRGVAAMAVFVYHFHHVPALEPLTEHAQGFFATGWIFVDLFFMLSGWVMGHVYHQRLISEPYALRTFLAARIARLYPLFLATLIAWYALAPWLGVVVDWAGLRACLPQLLTLSFTWGPLACAVPVAPAWSISAEAAVYLVFPLILWAEATATATRACALMLLGFLGYAGLSTLEGGIHTIDGMAPLRAAFGFAIGLGLWRLGDASILPKGYLAAALQVGAAIATVGLLLFGVAPLAIIVLFALLISSMVSGTGPVVRVCKTPFLAMLGRLSFGIYLWHWFVIVWMQQSAPAIPATALAAFAVVIVVLWSQISFRFIEAPGRRVLRGVLSRRIAGAYSESSR